MFTAGGRRGGLQGVLAFAPHATAWYTCDHRSTRRGSGRLLTVVWRRRTVPDPDDRLTRTGARRVHRRSPPVPVPPPRPAPRPPGPRPAVGRLRHVQIRRGVAARRLQAPVRATLLLPGPRRRRRHDRRGIPPIVPA